LLSNVTKDLFPDFYVLSITYENEEIKLKDLSKEIIRFIEKNNKKIDIVYNEMNILKFSETLIKNKIPLILFVDEIQDIYVTNNNSNHQLFVKNISTILEIGKSQIGYSIITGSSSRLKSIIFKRDDSYRILYQEYPNLNDTVFNNFMLKPIRNYELLISFLNIRYSSSGGSNIDIYDMYSKTGGIFGMIENYLSNYEIYSYDNTNQQLDKFRNEISNNNMFFWSICNFLYLKNIENFKKDKNMYFMQQRINLIDLREIAERRNINQYMEIIYDLIDIGFLIEVDIGQWEFLYPEYIFILNNYFLDFPTRMELMSLEGTLSKWGNKSSPGHSNEELLKKLISNWDEFPVEDCVGFEFYNRYISFSNISNNNKNILNIKNINVPEDLSNELFGLTEEEGIDGIMFIYNKSTKEMYCHILQIKTGGIDESIRLGNLNSKNKSLYYLAMIKSMENGFNKFKNKLNNKFIDININISSFTLITNKNINKEVEIYIKNNNKYNCYMINWDDIKIMLGKQNMLLIGY
jgi:hypothetical protein